MPKKTKRHNKNRIYKKSKKIKKRVKKTRHKKSKGGNRSNSIKRRLGLLPPTEAMVYRQVQTFAKNKPGDLNAQRQLYLVNESFNPANMPRERVGNLSPDPQGEKTI